LDSFRIGGLHELGGEKLGEGLNHEKFCAGSIEILSRCLCGVDNPAHPNK